MLLELRCMSSQVSVPVSEGLLQPRTLHADGKGSGQAGTRRTGAGENNSYGIIKIPAGYQECEGGGDRGVLGEGTGREINVSGLCPPVLALGREKNPQNFLVRPVGHMVQPRSLQCQLSTADFPPGFGAI